MRNTFSIILLLIVSFSLLTAKEKDKNKIGFYKPTVLGVLDTMAINNIFLPYQNDGSTAEDAQAYFPNGTNLSFLFQGGIAASGFVNNQLRCSWMAKASLIQEYQPGTWEERTNPDDGRFVFYTVEASDGPGSQAYQKWADAVALGADFQDLDPDGPGPLEPDGVYDPNVDRPDMLGDRISWAVYNDGTGTDIRSDGLQTEPLGLEVHQQVWAFARADELGNVIFFRYRFINKGGQDIRDLIFSIWADPDIGAAEDDLIGCDTTLSLGYIYNDGDDANYGPNPPGFGVDFFQGPVVESPGDTALLYRGPYFGIDTLVDRANLPMTSFVFYNNAGETDPFPSPQQNASRARDYQVGGFNGHHEPINPTVFGVGGQAGDPPQYFYPGDPEGQSGWRDTEAKDKRFMVNTGPFQLRAWNDENGNGRPDPSEAGVQDIVVAYVVAQGNTPTNSVTELKRVDEIAQLAYNANFFVAGPPPPPEVNVRTFDQQIEFVINLDANSTFDYDTTDQLLNNQVFEGLKIYQLNSPSTSERENDLLNRKLIFSFDVDNQYKDLFERNGNVVTQIYSGKNNIDPAKMTDDGSAIVRFVVNQDAFNQNLPLVNNTEYYFSITSFSINQGGEPPFLTDLGGGAWEGGSGMLLENNLGGTNLYRVIPNRNENEPFRGTTATYSGPRENHDGRVLVDVVNPEAVTGDDYSVRFFDNGNLYRIINESESGAIERDSLAYQDSVGQENWTFPIIDGLSVKVQNVADALASVDSIIDTSNPDAVYWATSSGALADFETSIYGGGADLVKNTNRANLSQFTKDKYFPVKIVLETSDVAVAQHYRAGWVIPSGMEPTFLTAWDMREPSRQLYVAYLNSAPGGTINLETNNEIVIFDADYQETERYGGANGDSLFKAESYIMLRLAAVADSLFQNNKMELVITPNYPNSDVDEFNFSTQDVLPKLSMQGRENMLDKVGVVPNPYWAYSAYETSYDTPVLKFIHLDKEVTIRIFNIAGQLIKTLYKNDETNEMSWDLRNEQNLKVASGMYIAHIEVPGVGEKVLKFAIIQREERLDRF